MTNEHLIAKRYAKAMFLIAKELGSINSIYQEVSDFFGEINKNQKIKKLLLNRCVPQKLKLVFCNTILESQALSDVVKKFICVLIDHKRLSLLEKVLVAFKNLVNEHNNIRVVEVTFAKTMDSEIIDKIKKQLSPYFKDEKLEFDLKIDKKILGGMVIKTGSRMIDFSILTKLYKMEHAIGCSTSNLIN